MGKGGKLYGGEEIMVAWLLVINTLKISCFKLPPLANCFLTVHISLHTYIYAYICASILYICIVHSFCKFLVQTKNLFQKCDFTLMEVFNFKMLMSAY